MPGSRGSANLVMRCKFCKRESSARKAFLYVFRMKGRERGRFIVIHLLLYYLEFEPKIGAYSAEKNNDFQKIAQFDCRGLELVDFSPRVCILH